MVCIVVGVQGDSPQPPPKPETLKSTPYTLHQVSMKRRMLRAKLAEADSPLPPPSRILP